MSLTINAKVYTADSFQQNTVGFIGSLKTVSVKDNVQLKRSAPKPTSLFSGVGKTQAKLTRTITLTGALSPSGEAIVSIDVSVPVGAAGVDVDSLLNDMGSFLSSASFKSHVKAQQISF